MGKLLQLIKRIEIPKLDGGVKNHGNKLFDLLYIINITGNNNYNSVYKKQLKIMISKCSY